MSLKERMLRQITRLVTRQATSLTISHKINLNTLQTIIKATNLAAHQATNLEINQVINQDNSLEI